MAKTIAAISTSMMPGGIGTIRISGDEARGVADKVFKTKGKTVATMPGYTAAFGKVYNGDSFIDEAVALVFAAPHSYTGEDVVEISCHGGEYVLKKVLRAVLDNGASPASAGEFTRRAFENGKMSLTQAEAVMDIIGATGEGALACANNAKQGGIFKKVTSIREKLIYSAALIAAYTDFPEEGQEEMDNVGFIDNLTSAKASLSDLVAGFDSGAILKNGVNCVIVGKPNVGKSTLMNLLAGVERSIVTDIAGTTRDIVEETVEVGPIRLNLADTAGIREGGDTVEQIGIDRAKKRAENAQLVLAVFDATTKVTDSEIALLEELSNKPKVIIMNKSDMATPDLSPLMKFGNPVVVSAKNSTGIEKLKDEILKQINFANIDPNGVILANERQLDAAKRALDALSQTLNDLEMGMPYDAVGVLLDDTISALLELTGERVSEAVVDEVFSKFCVGK